jgi:PII-like signaling protein
MSLSTLTIMEIPREAVLLRIFIGEHHQFDHLPLYEAIVLKAREMHLAGATVLRGLMGFGKSSRLHVAKRFKVSNDLPVVIELVDSREKIQAFLPIVDTMLDSGLMTLERAEVINFTPDPPEHRHSRRSGFPCGGPRRDDH